MATDVSFHNITTGVQTFYSTYYEAVSNANDYDVISIYAELNESIILRNLVDVFISPGTIINAVDDKAAITDDGNA